MEAFIDVIQADGTSERFPIEGDQITLGRAGDAGISLPTAAELELEHLLIAPRGRDGCWVSTTEGAATPTLLRGKPFSSGMVPWGSELTIGGLKFRVSDSSRADQAPRWDQSRFDCGLRGSVWLGCLVVPRPPGRDSGVAGQH